MSYYDAIHRYEPDENGKCTSGWYANDGHYVDCQSTQRSSTLHDDPSSDFRQNHDHGGGDCMCFEPDNCIGYYGHMNNYCMEQFRCPHCDTDLTIWIEPKSGLDTNLLYCRKEDKMMKMQECEYHER